MNQRAARCGLAAIDFLAKGSVTMISRILEVLWTLPTIGALIVSWVAVMPNDAIPLTIYGGQRANCISGGCSNDQSVDCSGYDSCSGTKLICLGSGSKRCGQRDPLHCDPSTTCPYDCPCQ